MRKSIAVFIFMLCSLTLFAGKTVLVLQSYHEGYGWVDDINQGIKDTIPSDVAELKFFFMDTKRKSSDEWKKSVSEEAKKLIDTMKPDVVIAGDDNAQAFVVKDYVNKADSPQFVFCGVNAEPDKYGFPADNVTGVLERPHFGQAFGLMNQINPEIKKVAILTEDTATGNSIMEWSVSHKGDADVVASDAVGELSVWKEKVKSYQDTADVICIQVNQTIKEDGDPVSGTDLMKWTMANTKIPIFGIYAFVVEDGAVCAIAEAGHEHGRLASEMTLQILNGKKAGDIPIVIPDKGDILFNVKAAEQFNLNISYDLLSIANKIYE